MQCKNFSEKVAKKFFVALIILPQKFHEPRAWYDSATASFARGPCTKVKNTVGTGPRWFLSGGPPMELSRDIARFARSRPVIECAQCGERIYIPEWSECVDGCRVRHLWQCDACGTSFETTVRFEAA